MAGPSSATPEVKAALRKLVRALPESFRGHAEAASTAMVIDPSGWDRTAAPPRTPPHLDAVQHAVIDGVQITLGYVARDQAATTRTVHPLGLATKGSAWYLVADTESGLRTFRVDRITSVDPTGDPVVRPDGFELAEAWRLITDEIDQRRTPVRARLLARPDIIGWCRMSYGNRMRIGPAGGDGRVEIELRGHYIESLAAEIAGFGAGIEVIEPDDLRRRLATIGGELTSMYGAPGGAVS